MKITKTTLLFIATLFFLALPLMFTSGNAQASVFNYDGAVHNGTTGLWEVPADASTCVGAVESDPVDSAAHLIDLNTIPTGEKCSTVEPAWVKADFTDQNTCENVKGFHWGGSCSGNSSGHPHTQVDCENLGGTWTAFCQNYYTENPAYATERSDHECLFCHNGGHATKRTGYLKGGHKNMSRLADGLPWAGSIANGSSPYSGYVWDNAGTTANGTPYASTQTDGTPVFWIYDGWIGSSPRAVTPGSSYSCGRCHTTGWSADASMQTTKEPAATFGPSIYIDVNLMAADDSGTMQPFSSWDHFGILCSKCHNAVDGGHANSGDPADDMEFAGGDITIGDAAASQNAKCYNCHRQVNSLNLPDNEHAPYPGEDLWIKDSHGSVGLESHANGFLNSPHARFSGKFSELKDSTKYDSHFISNDGGCAGCHNLHDSLTDTAVGGEPFENECGLTCHQPSSSYTPVGGMDGFHDNLLAAGTMPSTISTEDVCAGADGADQTTCENNGGEWITSGSTGANPEACVTCHMPGGLHLFRISVDGNYTTFPGPDQLMPTVPNSDGFPEAFVDAGLACLQCHGAKTCSDSDYDNETDCTDNGGTWQNAANTKEFTKKAVASGVSGNYHEEPTVFTASGTDQCLECHADKETFLSTGHYNDARMVPGDFDLTGPDGAVLECGHDGFYNKADGKCYADLDFSGSPLYTPIFFHHSWFEPEEDGDVMISSGRPVAAGDSFNCAPCHTTGFKNDNSGPITADSLGITVGDNSNYLYEPITITGNAASWEFLSVQCAKCHGENLNPDSHDASATATAPTTNALCGQCHEQKHHPVVGFLGSPHGGYTGTVEEAGEPHMENAWIADPNSYDSENHFVSNYNGCAGCHNVHATIIPAAESGSEYAGFNNECGITCHGQGSSSHSKNLSDINHPSGTGTPLDGVTADNAMDACVVCHMPDKQHYFVINTDPTYSTPGEQGAHGFEATPFVGEVDLAHACGQCHAAGNAPAAGAPELSVDELAQYAQAMHSGAVDPDTVKLFIWVNDGSEDWRVNFQVTGSACPDGGCTFTWDFGDGSSEGNGPTPSHTYADGTTVDVTLTINYPDGTHYDHTQPVTPTEVHKLPTCGIATDPAAVTSGNIGDMISFTDDSHAGTGADGDLGVIVNWGDGTAFTSGNAGDAFTHTYMVSGGYQVVETVKDGLGFSCENHLFVTINKPNVAVATTGLTLNALYSGTWGTPETISYYVKGLNSFGQMVTKVAGNMAPGTQTTVNLGPDEYDVYLYYPTGHSCTPSTNPTHVDLSSGAATVLIYGCN